MILTILSVCVVLYVGAFWGYGKALKDQEALRKYTKRGQ
jgi:hypothetical protein